ncbi:hypothetical protein HETIRDRAFT_109291 [Heterobasidion irregulare TC 32-1]|uniref:Uncharacterized protein n=1 Tax=Heterobasidion irregulare (strain TC 32-1) TaxID=747525 RepID=W4KIH1_HETIT|nr:uncharacterized protein HETIRDRAFT_109291 [Heterobasidion irregulare TC 32-1]ETW84841.1 hypothetical protein HETIRDRAFT_109291 [Heterobasidion irregulare TC 32-1]
MRKASPKAQFQGVANKTNGNTASTDSIEAHHSGARNLLSKFNHDHHDLPTAHLYLNSIHTHHGNHIGHAPHVCSVIGPFLPHSIHRHAPHPSTPLPAPSAGLCIVLDTAAVPDDSALNPLIPMPISAPTLFTLSTPTTCPISTSMSVSVPVVSIPALEIVTAPQDMRPRIPPANANALHRRQGADTLTTTQTHTAAALVPSQGNFARNFAVASPECEFVDLHTSFAFPLHLMGFVSGATSQ